jgi:hypothetical protein
MTTVSSTLSSRISGRSRRRRPRLDVVRAGVLSNCMVSFDWGLPYKTWLVVSFVPLAEVRLEIVEEEGDETLAVGGVTIDRRRLEDGGGDEKGGVVEALFVAFLAKVSTKLDFSDLATLERVACRRRLRSEVVAVAL